MCEIKFIEKIFNRHGYFKKEEPVIDEDRKRCREHFQIIDKYLIEYELETNWENEEIGYVVFIDEENDCDWKDERDHNTIFGEGGRVLFADAICKLNVAHATPCTNLEEYEILTFKKMIGAGYASALNGDFGIIDSVIKDAKDYLRQMNKEKARSFFLNSAGLFSFAVTVLFCIVLFAWNPQCSDWLIGIWLGILGSYISIWTRYGRLELTGLSSKKLHYLESISRLIVGAVFAVVAMYAVDSNMIFYELNDKHHASAFALAGFIAGFSERFVPSLMEHMTNK